MNLERLRWGEWIAAIAALDLLLVTFRAWYKVSGTGAHITAWDALDNGRYLLIATAVVGIFLWLIKAAEDTQQLSFPPGWIAAVVGLACTIYIAYRLATPPADNLDPDIGLFLGLVSAFGVAVGGLLSAREEEPVVSQHPATDEAAAPTDTFGSPVPEAVGAAGGQTWSPAAPVPSSSGWSPAAPTATVPPATAAGALGEAERPLRAGDSVVLTAGGARFPAGTVAEVVEIFAGGALVEVKAPDGMAERFEVPESAYERATAAGAAAATPAGEGWSPAMPAPASEDWGFDEPAAERNGEATATDTADPGVDGPKSEKVPWWKREIGGGGKKKKAEEAAELGAAGALGAAAVTDGDRNGSGSEKPGFFKRLFGGGAKDESATETLESETTPASDVAGLGQAAEADTAVDEPAAESSVEDTPSTEASEPEPPAEPAASESDAAVEPAAFEPEPRPEASAPEPAAASEPEPEAEPVVDPDSETAVSEADPEPAASAVEPAVDEEPEPDVPEPDPEPAASAPEPEPPVDPEPPVAPEPEVIASEEHAPGVPASEPGSEPTADAADEEAPKPKRGRSSGSRKIPKEALAGTTGDQPKVGDEVQLMVGGGRFDAGTKGTVVDVFSAGVIVELSDDEGRSERLDLPFEAIGPADA